MDRTHHIQKNETIHLTTLAEWLAQNSSNGGGVLYSADISFVYMNGEGITVNNNGE
jgi:hypothetical protein